MKPKILFLDATDDLLRLWAEASHGVTAAIDINAAPVASEDVPEILRPYDTCINDATYFPSELLEKCRGLRHIVFLGTGASSYIDLAAAAALGIKVSTIRSYGDVAVAEHAFGLMLAASRETAAMDRKIRAGGWGPIEGSEMRGKTLGVIGLGGIGREMARLGQAIGMKVVAWNRTRTSSADVPILDLNEVLRLSDVLSLHLALTDETRGLLGAEQLGRMKPGAILVNTARAGLVNRDALANALASGHIRHAALDVFDQEPPEPNDPLIQLENVTLTSHAGFLTPEATKTMLRTAIELASAGY